MPAFFDDLRVLLDNAAPLTTDRVCEVLAQHYGGTRVYIPRRLQPPLLEPLDTPATLIARGVKRRTAYNWVTRWRP